MITINQYQSFTIISTNSLYAAVVAANFLQPAIDEGFVFNDGELVQVRFVNASGTFTSTFFSISKAGADITLIPAEQGVTLPVVNNHLAVFDGTTGLIKDGGAPPTPPTLGTAAAKAASDNTKANLASVTAATVIGNLPQTNDITGTIGDSGLIANRSLQCTFANPDAMSNLIQFTVSVTVTALNAGIVTLFSSSGSKRYRIIALYLAPGNQNFSGGGGDRNLTVRDGSFNAYSVIPAASVQTTVNSTWGSVALPFPSFALNTQTSGGEDLEVIYSGGAANYTAGEVFISGLLQRADT